MLVNVLFGVDFAVSNEILFHFLELFSELAPEFLFQFLHHFLTTLIVVATQSILTELVHTALDQLFVSNF